MGGERGGLGGRTPNSNGGKDPLLSTIGDNDF
jgi:hypothetical protein